MQLGQLQLFILSSLLFSSTLGRKLPASINTDTASCATLSSSCPNPDPATPVYFPDPASCHSFCECSDGIAKYVPCSPSTLVYDPTEGVCVTDTEYPCSTGTLLMKKPSGILDDYPECAASVSAECPNPDPQKPVYLPNPDDDTCSTFCQCSNGIAYLNDCAPGTLYSSTAGECVLNSTVTCDTSGSSTVNSIKLFH